MLKTTLEFLNNIPLEISNNEILLWITHNKDKTCGTFYKIIPKDEKIYYCIQKENSYNEFLIKKYSNFVK